MSNGAVHDRRPAEEEDAGRRDATSFGGGSDGDGGNQGREHRLINAVHDRWDLVVGLRNPEKDGVMAV